MVVVVFSLIAVFFLWRVPSSKYKYYYIIKKKYYKNDLDKKFEIIIRFDARVDLPKFLQLSQNCHIRFSVNFKSTSTFSNSIILKRGQVLIKCVNKKS